MDGPATSRLGLAPAPRGLCVVQELVNTATLHPKPVRIHDLLATTTAAQEWLDGALAQWAAATGQPAPGIVLTERDLGPLRELREALRRRLVGSPEGRRGSWSGTLAVAVEGAASTYRPLGTGAAAVESLVATEYLLAQLLGVDARLRACPATPCGVAFYDGSKNASRVWHDVRTCGNRHNLQASRARRRSARDGT